jgi:hypothetical protein
VAKFLLQDQYLMSIMTISENSFGLVSNVIKLLTIRIGTPTPTEPVMQRLETMVGKLCQGHLEAIDESLEVTSCLILFQVIILGFSIWEFVFGPSSEPWYWYWVCHLVFSGIVYLVSFGFLIREGMSIFWTWKRMSRQNNQEISI